MSWDVFLMQVPQNIVSPQDLPEDFLSELGPRATVLAALSKALPALDLNDPAWGVLRGGDYSIEFNMGDDDPMDRIMLHVRGSDAALEPIRRVCEATGWRALDLSTGLFIDFNQDPAAGLRQWRSFRDYVVARLRAEGKDVQLGVAVEGKRVGALAREKDSDTPAHELFDQALQEIDRDRPEEALALLQRTIDLAPNMVAAYAVRGEALSQLERYGEALADLTLAQQLAPGDAWVLAHRGSVLRHLGRYDEALADIHLALNIDPAYNWAVGIRADIYRRMGRPDEALAGFDAYLANGGDSGWGGAMRGDTLRQMGRYAEALDDLNRCLELDPYNAFALRVRGQTYRQLDRHEEALTDLSHAIEIDPNTGWAFAQRSMALRLSGHFPAALTDVDHSIALGYAPDWVYAERGEILRSLGRYGLALADLTRAVDSLPEDGWVRNARAMTYRALGQYGEALEDLNRILEGGVQGGSFFGSRAEVRLQLGQWEEAHADLDRALALRSDDWYTYLRAICLKKQGDILSAQTYLAQALDAASRTYEAQPGNHRNTFNLALYHLAAGNSDRAMALYEEVLALHASWLQIQAAMQDLLEYRALFPGDAGAVALRELMNQARMQHPERTE